MTTYADASSVIYYPSGAATRLNHATGGQATTSELTVDYMYSIQVGSTAIRIRLGSTSPTVAATDLELPAGAYRSWTVQDGTKFLGAIASDGSSSWEAWVWKSSPRQTTKKSVLTL